jgi:transposase
MLAMHKQSSIQTLHKQGKRNADIARIVGCHRNTVWKVIKRDRIIEKQTRRKTSELDVHKEQIEKWLDEDITRVRIYQKLQEGNRIKSTYANLCDYIKKHVPSVMKVFGVQNTAPGEEAELDFGYLGVLPGKDGRNVKTWELAVILAYSRVGYYAICYDQKLDTLCSELKQAFAYFGGVPKKLKVDNMKTVVVTNQKFELDFNQDFLEFAQHYNVVIVPCTPYSPEQKGKVESGIKYLQQNFINGRDFVSDQDIAA